MTEIASMMKSNGLESLRELALGIGSWRTIWTVSTEDYDEKHGLHIENEGGSLREALLKIADQIERETAHDPSKDVSMSAYDLLPEEDRKAIAWVREKGGLNALNWGFQDADNRRIELCSSLGIDLETGWADAMAAMRRRLMPAGMEWPRFEDGEPVRLGEHWQQEDYDESITRIDSIEFAEDGVRFENEYADAFYRYGERVKRPAPKVLDADGVEIREGDEVWPKYPSDRDDEQVVRAIVLTLLGDGQVEVESEYPNGEKFHEYVQTDRLTHRAPVLAADGLPLREGETVWDVESGTEYEVVGIRTDEDSPVRVMRTDGSHLAKAAKPSTLTHQRPESWKRLEEDAGKNPFDYCKDVGHRLDTCENAEWYKARDLVRRAKALAGVER